ncbi:MAG: sirohydrochlorin cobaltochelatase [Candidatus Omnitrophota bacterium]|jgi:sirohydrochlorin cobaltochelatase
MIMKQLNKVIIMVSHGMPPSDYPPRDKVEFFRLMSRFHNDSNTDFKSSDYERYVYLEKDMRDWPRNRKNDPFSIASQLVAKNLSQKADCPVICAFNEFASPSIEDAFERAIQMNPDEIMVITPMMIRGGSHSDKDIPQAIVEARKKYPHIKLSYIWPFAEEDIAEFLFHRIEVSERNKSNAANPLVNH